MTATRRSFAGFAIAYDFRDPDAWELARRHRDHWGRTWTRVHLLDPGHVVLVFSSAGPRWAAWEEVRRGWIEGAA